MPTTPLPADDLLFTTQFDNYAGYDSYVAAQMLMQAISEFQDKRMATEVAISQSNLEQQKKMAVYQAQACRSHYSRWLYQGHQ